MIVLVTGANGLVGANLVRELLSAGHTVRAFVRPTSDRRSVKGLAVNLVFGDVLNRESLLAAAQGCDLLFHAAAAFTYWDQSSGDLMKLAVQGTRHVVEAAHDAGVRRVVLTSSSVVLGSSAHP